MKKAILILLNLFFLCSASATSPADTNGDGRVTTEDVDFIYDYIYLH